MYRCETLFFSFYKIIYTLLVVFMRCLNVNFVNVIQEKKLQPVEEHDSIGNPSGIDLRLEESERNGRDH